MVQLDQPICFPSNVLVAVSSKDDGTMLDRTIATHDEAVQANRKRFCHTAGLSYDDVVYQRIIYGDEQSYDCLREVSSQDTSHTTPEIHADAVFTHEIGVGIFLPVADCVATVVCDSLNNCLAVLHLGRHSTMTVLVAKVLEHFVQRGSDLTNILVWMSPSAKKDTYQLDWFDHESDQDWKGYFLKNDHGYLLDLPGYNRQRFIEAGVKPENIFISAVDTVRDESYFSHSTGDKSGRIAVVAMMR